MTPEWRQYEAEADSLLRAFHKRDAQAIDRVHQRLPQAKALAADALLSFPLTLDEARTVIAREQGLQSWGELRLNNKLKRLDYGDALERFKQLVIARDADELDAWLTSHPELRETLDDPHFDFGSTAIIIAKDSLTVVDALLKHGADINAKSQWWAGDFHALELTSAELAQALIERGADVTVHAAAEQGWLDWLEAACENDPSIVNQRGGDGKTPLHYANDPAVMDFLLARGADLEARDLDHQSTPLQWKIAERNLTAARELIKRGAVVDIFAAIVLDNFDLVKAALRQHPEAIRARVNHDGYALTPTADGSHQYVYAFNCAGMSPHQVALDYGCARIFDYLLSQSPRDVQLMAYCAAGDADSARKIAAGDPHIISRLSDADQRQLLRAAWTDSAAIVTLMLSLGFNPHIRDDDAMTPLHWAAFHGCNEAVAVLLEADDHPPLDWLNVYGGTPLGACLYGRRHSWRGGGDHLACAQMLVDAGSPFNANWLPTGDEAIDAILADALERRGDNS